MTNAEALTLVTMLCNSYPREVREATIEAYAMGIADLPVESCGAAMQRLVRTSKWLPTIAEIRTLEARERLPEIPTVDEAWGQAVAMMGNGWQTTAGPYVRQAVNLLGRHDQVREAQLAWLRPRFYEIYERLTEQVREATAAGYVPDWLPRLCSPEERTRLGIEAPLVAIEGRKGKP